MSPATPGTVEVRVARNEDLPELSRVLGRAFADDPVMNFVIPSGPVAERAAVIFDVFARLHLDDASVYVAVDGDDGAVVGAAIWADPGHWKVPNSAYARYGARLGRAVGPRGAVRAIALTEMERRHPKEPHHYLAVLGTDPDRRGLGIGVALMAPVLRRCDEEGLPAYLESSKDSNVPYYERQGFDVVAPLPIRRGPVLTTMWREPRPPDY